MSGRLVKWNRTTCGSTFSRCGRFSITPAKSGRDYVGFALEKKGTVSTPGAATRFFSEDHGNFPTIARAKAAVEVIVKSELRARDDAADFNAARAREGAVYCQREGVVYHRSPGGVESRVAIVDAKHDAAWVVAALNEKAEAEKKEIS